MCVERATGYAGIDRVYRCCCECPRDLAPCGLSTDHASEMLPVFYFAPPASLCAETRLQTCHRSGCRLRHTWFDLGKDRDDGMLRLINRIAIGLGLQEQQQEQQQPQEQQQQQQEQQQPPPPPPGPTPGEVAANQRADDAEKAAEDANNELADVKAQLAEEKAATRLKLDEAKKAAKKTRARRFWL